MFVSKLTSVALFFALALSATGRPNSKPPGIERRNDISKGSSFWDDVAHYRDDHDYESLDFVHYSNHDEHEYDNDENEYGVYDPDYDHDDDESYWDQDNDGYYWGNYDDSWDHGDDKWWSDHEDEYWGWEDDGSYLHDWLEDWDNFDWDRALDHAWDHAWDHNDWDHDWDHHDWDNNGWENDWDHGYENDWESWGNNNNWESWNNDWEDNDHSSHGWDNTWDNSDNSWDWGDGYTYDYQPSYGGMDIFAGASTVYSQDGLAGSCGKVYDDEAFICALGNAWMNYEYMGDECGRRIRVTNLGSHYPVGGEGRSIIVTVMDTCESCDEDHIDLSIGAWNALTDYTAPGLVNVEWAFI